MNTLLLEFSGATLAEEVGHVCVLREVSLALGPGELIVVEASAEHSLDSLADLACGLLEPEQGEVRFEGVAWPQRSPEQAAAARSRIGRVFEGAGWISNLDVDENLTLSARYHGQLSDEQAYADARALARRLGLVDLPPGRPAHMARSELRRAEWVRALLGKRALVVLQAPLRDVPRAWAEALLAEIERQRAAGVAFLWLQPEQSYPVERLKPTLHFRVENGNILRA